MSRTEKLAPQSLRGQGPLRRPGMVWLLGSLLLLCTMPAAAERFAVADIEIQGLERIDPGTLFAYLPVSIGDRFDTDNSADIIRTLFKTGFFERIALARRGDILVVQVKERAAIAEINIEGNREVKTEQLEEALEDIGLVKGRTFNPSVLERITLELERLYFSRGKYGVRIETEVTELDKNRVRIDLDIAEGIAARIRDIRIVGNSAFSDEELMDDFELGIPGFFAIFSSRDQYSKQKLSADLETLRSFYQDRGYLEYSNDSTQVTISPDKKDMRVVINISEGEIYTVRDVQLAGDLAIDAEALREVIKVEAGSTYSRKQVADDSAALTQRLGVDGFAFAEINVIPDIDREAREVGLTYFVDPGKRVYVRRIEFEGNFSTREEVLRRELRQMEGGWYAGKKIDRSKVRLQRLPYLQAVEVDTVRVPGSDDQIDLVYSVEERLSGTFTIGAGFSQSQGVILNLGLAQDNFLGTGNRVSLNIDNSAARTLYSFGFTDPYHTIDGVSRSFNLFYREIDAEELNIARYGTNTYGGTLTYGIPLSELNSVRLGGGIEHIDILTGTQASQDTLDFIDENGDSFNSLKLLGSWIHDSRNRALFPDQGSRVRVPLELGTPIGDLTYYKLGLQGRKYWGLTKKYTLAARGELGYGGSYGDLSELPFFERYFAGGIRSVRGYEDNSLGPRDSKENDPVGGSFQVEGGVEILFPPPLAEQSKSTRLSLFVDVGNVFSDVNDFEASELRASAGVAFVWLSPIGALTFSFGQALNNEPEDELQAFQFAVGGSL